MRWWNFRLWGARREIILNLDTWSWPASVWRFNGGGYMGSGPDPYHEFSIGPLRFRKYGYSD